jgi:hypothetical protein
MPVVVPSRKSLCRGRSTEARSIFGTVQQAIVHQLMNPLEARLFGFGRAVCSVDKRASNACTAFSGHTPPGSSPTWGRQGGSGGRQGVHRPGKAKRFTSRAISFELAAGEAGDAPLQRNGWHHFRDQGSGQTEAPVISGVNLS